MTESSDLFRTAKPPKKAGPVYLIAAAAAVIVAAVVTHFTAEYQLPKGIGLPAIARWAGIIAVVTSAFVWAVMTGASLRRKTDGNLLAIIVIAATAATVFLTLIVETRLYDSRQKRVDAVFISLYAETVRGFEAYNARLDELHVPAMTSAQRLSHGFNAGQAINALKAAHEADDRFHADLDVRIMQHRRQIDALKIPKGQKDVALRAFDREFRHVQGRLKQLTAYETYRLRVMEGQVGLLSKSSWSARTAWVVFSSPSATMEWQTWDRYRADAESNMRVFENALRRRARG